MVILKNKIQKILGYFLEEIIKKNKNFRIFGPDEALSNRLNAVFDATNRQFNGKNFR